MKKETKSPFFKRFLENQKEYREIDGSKLKGGKPDETMKWPSDGDEW